jgi:hypothetical protein
MINILVYDVTNGGGVLTYPRSRLRGLVNKPLWSGIDENVFTYAAINLENHNQFH